MTIDLAHANAYSEVIEILKYISEESYNKIPKEKIEVFENYSNKEYQFDYNPYLTLDKQNVSEITKTIIAILFRDYWATPEQRDKIKAKERYDIQKEEEEKRKKYNNIDNLFTDNLNIIKENQNIKENTLLIEYKESIFHKIISKIKSFFRKK